MRIFPQSQDEWRAASYLMLRVYVAFAFLGSDTLRFFWPRHGDTPDVVIILIFSYVVCLAIFSVSAISDLSRHRGSDAVANLISAFGTFFILCHSMRYLSNT
jgi:hypothetical protein